ncbi:LysM peptidoglycan-binding domain-containing protein [Streptomyces armeniacus]|uniref:LysM peptidoglycan-binding domain-containing protein n=1 Tax=Streptomyces armeniacus TaxID=83291 RepID=A0A345XSM0_9ACTN|nr:LysM peptidoglycan-binding domain-containing protein [Streptomyces armeniacus]AXK34636.1 LysM peptidoglycan-binding domain-containing protein [Streptomyces armeniacus]
MSRGRHRRPRITLNARRISRLSIVLAAGGAGIAAPVLTGTAHAAPAPASAKAQAPAQAPAHAGAAQSETDPQSQGKKSGKSDSYTVASGDTLHRIATDHGVEGGWNAVYEANRDTIGGNPDLIVPGQQLTLDASSGGAEKSAAPGKAQGGANADQAAAKKSGGVYKTQSTNLDGWINEALAIMEKEGIPGSYDGIHRNIMRESGGDPNVSNNWDINAQNGTPSIGLLQVIKPTFDAFHVEGTANDQRDPVANIVAACNYAAQTYGSIDNVNGPY